MTLTELITVRRKASIPSINNYDQMYAERLALTGELTRLFEYGVAQTKHPKGWTWRDNDKPKASRIDVLSKMLELLHNLIADFALANETIFDDWKLAWQEDDAIETEFRWKSWTFYEAISYLASMESARPQLIVAFVGVCKYFEFSRAEVEKKYQAFCEGTSNDTE